MAWIVDLAYVLGTLSGISDKKIRSGPLTEKEIILLKREISNLIMRAENAYNNGLYSDSCKEYIKAVKLENINPGRLPDAVDNLKKRIEHIENLINKDLINKSILTLEKGDYLKSEARFQDAFDEYQKVFSVIKTMKIFDINLRATRINEVYLKQISCLIEKGDENEKSTEIFNKAVELSGNMITSREKTEIVKKLNRILDTFSEKIKQIIESGISLTMKNQFEEASQLFQEAQNMIKEKYGKLPNTMTNRFKETNDLREIDKLIEQSKNKIVVDVNSTSLLGTSSDEETYDIEEKKEFHGIKPDQPSHYTCKYCGIELNEKPRFCPKCGIICRENST